MKTKHDFFQLRDHLFWLTTFLLLTVGLTGQAAIAATGASGAKQKALSTTSLSPQSAAPAVLRGFKDPNDDVNIELKALQSGGESLEMFSPANMAKFDEAYRKSVESQCFGKMNRIKRFAKRLPVEAGAFYTGLAMSAALQMNGDPASLLHFQQNSLTSYASYVSYGFFLLGSHLTTASLEAMGLLFSPCHELKTKGLASGERMDVFKPTSMQMKWLKVAGPLAMLDGFLLSTPVGDLLSDADIKLCAASLFSNPGSDQMKQAETQACNDSYKKWVTTERIWDYVPDLLSMTGAFAAQAYVYNPLLHRMVAPAAKSVAKGIGSRLASLFSKLVPGAEQAATKIASRQVIIESISVLSRAGGPVVQVAVGGGGMLVFLTLNDFIMKGIQLPIEQWHQGTEITAILNQLDYLEQRGWNPITEKQKPPECDPTQYPYPGYIPPVYCSDTTRIGPLVTGLNDKYLKWRQALLADAYTKSSQWRDYLQNFATEYVDSQNFYGAILNNIAAKRMTNAAPSDDVTAMYSSIPYNGMVTHGLDAVCSISDAQKAQILTAAEIADNAIKQLQSGALRTYDAFEQEELGTIYAGLRLVDCSTPTTLYQQVASLNRAGIFTMGDIKSDAFAKADAAYRAKQVKDALATLYGVLANDPVMSDGGRSSAQPSYQKLATWNPFAALKLLLGDSKPLPEGEAYLMAVNNDDDLITQATKDDHPTRYGFANTPTMTDFLLASMVCGPNVQSPAVITVSPYEQSASYWFNIALRHMGWTFADTSNEHFSSMLYVETDGRTSELVPQYYGVRAVFRPPQVVDMGSKTNFCANSTVASTLFSGNNTWNLHDVEATVRGQHATGFLSFVKQFVRPDVMPADGGNFNFTNWWTPTVDEHVSKVVDLFREDFRHIVNQVFVPKFVDQRVQLFNGRNFELGVGNSLFNQAKLNLRLLTKAYYPTAVSRAGGPSLTNANASKAAATQGAGTDKFKKLKKQFLVALLLQINLYGTPDQAKNAVYWVEKNITQKSADQIAVDCGVDCQTQQRFKDANDALKQVLNDTITDLQAEGSASPTALSGDGVANRKDLAAAALSGLGALVTETDSYFGVVDTVKVGEF